MIESGNIDVSIKNGIGTITFSHPKSNALPGALLNKLAEEITAIGKNPDVKVVILRSEGEKAFCAGASFEELLAIDNFERGKEFFMGFAGAINALRKCPKFIIGRVQGKAVGGGVGIASAVDYCLALDTASIKLSELALGIGPFVVGPAIERKMGTSAFATLTINPTEWKDAAWAKGNGLYADVFTCISDLDQAVHNLAEKLANSSPVAMEKLKSVLWDGTGHWDKLLEERAEISGKLVLSDFTAKAIDKFRAQKNL